MSKFIFILSITITLLFSGPIFAEQNKTDKEKVLASINKKTITLKDFNRTISELPQNMAERAKRNKLDFLNYLVRKELLYQEGIKKKIDQNPEVAQKVEQFKHELIIQEFLSSYLNKVKPVTDKEVKEFYEKNKALFQTKEEITASHILLKTEKDAKGVLEELKKGKDFHELAKKRSTGPSASKGGRLGSFSRGTMVPEFEEVAFKLKKGEISPVVKTPFGYHIILVTDRTDPQELDFAQVKEKIKNQLKYEREQKALNELVDNLVKDAKIEINEENLR